ncbi:MAG: hypothetical protein EHM12_11190 [Dehalococcoidia bacterium]|nr:MAG: hypothetical protein EHM12_11190 [Dehalococcoidia bacterium]
MNLQQKVKMNLTDKQKEIIKAAINLLEPFARKDVSSYTHYFKVDDNDIHEYDCCDNKKCVKKALKNIIKSHEIQTSIEICSYDNGGDHEKIGHCYICWKPLNQSLTWIKDEFEHHKEYTITRKDLTDKDIAFEIKCILESMPSSDYDTGIYYQKHQKKFIRDIINYAKVVIKELKGQNKNG